MLTVERPNAWCELKRGECFAGDLLKMMTKDATKKRSAVEELRAACGFLSSAPQTPVTRAALAHIEAALRRLGAALWENN